MSALLEYNSTNMLNPQACIFTGRMRASRPRSQEKCEHLPRQSFAPLRLGLSYLYRFIRFEHTAPSPALPRWGREPDSSPQRGEAGRGADPYQPCEAVHPSPIPDPQKQQSGFRTGQRRMTGDPQPVEVAAVARDVVVAVRSPDVPLFVVPRSTA